MLAGTPAVSFAVSETSPEGSETGTISPWSEERLNRNTASENTNGQAIASDDRDESDGVYVNGTNIGPATTMLIAAVATGVGVGFLTYILLSVRDRRRKKKIMRKLIENEDGPARD